MQFYKNRQCRRKLYQTTELRKINTKKDIRVTVLMDIL